MLSGTFHTKWQKAAQKKHAQVYFWECFAMFQTQFVGKAADGKPSWSQVLIKSWTECKLITYLNCVPINHHHQIKYRAASKFLEFWQFCWKSGVLHINKKERNM